MVLTVRNRLRKLQAAKFSACVNWCHEHEIMGLLEMALCNSEQVINIVAFCLKYLIQSRRPLLDNDPDKRVHAATHE
jgi:hypothetical protein